MASPPPPAPPPPSPSIPLPPTPFPVFSSKALDEQARSAMATAPPAPPLPLFPNHPHQQRTCYTVAWGTADPGSEGCEMSTNNMGMVGGQDDVDGGDPQIGRDNGGKLQQCKNMVAKQNRPKKLNHRSLVPEIIKDLTISRMIQQMQLKFNQYWIETYKSACIPVILDPRFKYDFLEFLLNEFGSEEEARKWMSEVKQIMEDLFDEYSKEVSVQSQRESDTEVEHDDDPLAKVGSLHEVKKRAVKQ